MAETGGPDRPRERTRRHETTDLPIFPLVILGLATAVGAVLIFLLLYFTFEHYERRDEATGRTRPRTAVPEARSTPPEPRLQGVPGYHENLPRTDRLEMEAEDRRILQSYGPTGEEGFVRIPIERAMDLLLERGLPPGRPAGTGGPR